MALLAVKDSTNKNENEKISENKTEIEAKDDMKSEVPQIHYENKPELIWENMQMIAFNNKIFLKLA